MRRSPLRRLTEMEMADIAVSRAHARVAALSRHRPPDDPGVLVARYDLRAAKAWAKAARRTVTPLDWPLIPGVYRSSGQG